jgi:3-oxoacyl-[acyl-carrier-protein] synthase-3
MDHAAHLNGSYFEMNGRRIFRLAAEQMPMFLSALLSRAQLKAADIDVWVPHQASGHGIEHMRQLLGLSAEKFVSTLETRGNQVAASLPVALHQGIRSGQIRPGNLVALVGTGAGLSLAGALLRY